MKKSLFFILFNILMVFMVSGCGEETQGTQETQVDPNAPQPLPDIKTLQGTYNIEFFYTDGGGIAVLTTDCSKVEEYGGTTSCEKGYMGMQPTTSVTHKGEVTIKVNNNNSLKIQSKVEMYDPNEEDETKKNQGFAMAKKMGANYNFTDFEVIPANAISKYKINDPATTKNEKGVKGRNATEVLSYEVGKEGNNNAANSTYEFTILKDGTLVNKMKDTSSYVAANVIIRMKKKSNDVITLDANTPYDARTTDNFNKEIKYE